MAIIKLEAKRGERQLAAKSVKELKMAVQAEEEASEAVERARAVQAEEEALRAHAEAVERAEAFERPCER
eukprot:3265159-Lingulodinium_polyedra.AAC.1